MKEESIRSQLAAQRQQASPSMTLAQPSNFFDVRSPATVPPSRQAEGAKRLGLRADMDALPITEATGLAHASCHVGVMHA
jgi:hypothetical protein